LDEGWLNTVRLARDLGDISSLFPPGVTRLWDLPHTLHTAIRSALYFLSFEELPEKERPPRHMWLDGESMTQWWREVKANRESQMKGEGSYTDMPQNDLLKQFFGGRVPRGV
jgi:hypothetical protein